jgi:hypothetical protein
MRNTGNGKGQSGRHIVLACLVSLAAACWAFVALAADAGKPTDTREGGPVTVGGILTSDGNVNSLMVLLDGGDTPVKLVFAENFDKKALKDVFSDCRVQVTFLKNENSRTLLAFKKEPTRVKGTVTGVVVYGNDWWIAVKPPNGPPDGYAVDWPPKDIQVRKKSLKKGDTVTIKFHTDTERHRIETLDVVPQKPAATTAPAPPKPANPG